MKRLFTIACAILASSQAFAGNLVEPAMEPEVVEAATGSSGGAMIVPILMLLLMGAAIASAGGGAAQPPARVVN